MDAKPIVFDEAIRDVLTQTPPLLDVMNGDVDLPPHITDGAERNKEAWLSCPECGVTPELEGRYYYGLVYQCPECDAKVDIDVM